MPNSQTPPLPPPPKFFPEVELTQQFRDLISSLPREKGWILDSSLYQYQGFWHTSKFLGGILQCRQHFEAQHTDIFVVTYPKSGTTWLKAITFALLNRTHYPNTNNHPLLTSNPHVLVPFMELMFHHEKDLPDSSSFTSPRLFASHLPFGSLPKSVQDSECKIIYLCRNPKDTLISLWHFANKLRPKEQAMSVEAAFDMFCRGVSVYGPFWDQVLGYWKESLKNPKKVLFLKFEEMKEHPEMQLRRIAEFMGCPFSQLEERAGIVDEIRQLCSFETLSNLEVNKAGKFPAGAPNSWHFRQGDVGDWKNYLTEEMADRLDKISEENFSGYGLKL